MTKQERENFAKLDAMIDKVFAYRPPKKKKAKKKVAAKKKPAKVKAKK